MIVCLFVLALKVAFCHSAPSAPGNFILSSVAGSPQELEANWTVPDTPNGEIQSYTVLCNDSRMFTFNGSELSVRLTDLEPFTAYECTVSAATDGGVGNDSEPSVARTDEAGKLSIIM